MKITSAFGLVSGAGVLFCAPLADILKTPKSKAPPRLVLPFRIILPPPPAPTWSAEFVSTPVRAHWNRTTPATCALRHQSRRPRSRRPPVRSTTERSHRSTPAGLERRSTIWHRRHAQPAEFALPASVRPPAGFRSQPPRN